MNIGFEVFRTVLIFLDLLHCCSGGIGLKTLQLSLSIRLPASLPTCL